MALALVIGVSSPARAATVEELQAIIVQLTNQLVSVQAQLRALQGEVNPSVGRGITVNLTLGSRGDDVVRLQNFLISKGYLTIATGVAKGYFGPTTRTAVVKYQVANNLSEKEGYVGPITREKINAEISGGNLPTPVTQVLTPVSGSTVVQGKVLNISWSSILADRDGFQLVVGNTVTNSERQLYDVVSEIATVDSNRKSFAWNVPDLLTDFTKNTRYSKDQIKGAFYLKVNVIKKDEVGDRVIGSAQNKFTVSGVDSPTAFLNIDRVKFNKTTGMLDVSWKSTGIPSDKVVSINLLRKDNPETYEVNLTQGYCAAQGGCIAVSTGKASFKLSEYKTISGKPLEGEYSVRLSCWNKNSETAECPNKGFDTDTVEISSVTSSSAAVESTVESESRLGDGKTSVTLRPGAYENVYGIKYKVSGDPVVIERVDLEFVNQKNKRSAAEYIDTIQLLDMNQRSFATIQGTVGDNEDGQTRFRFTGLSQRLENNGGFYIRVNTKKSFPEEVKFKLTVPTNGLRYTDDGVSETYGRAQVITEINFVPSIVVNESSAAIPLNSPLYQKVEIVLPNGVKQTFMEKSGTNPAPLLTSMDKVTIAQGSAVTVNGKNLVVGGENMVFIDTLKGATYQVNAQAFNNADGGQRITFTVDSTWAPGQYYVYVLNKNGTSNYRGLTIMSAQGANAYSGFMDALNYIQGQLSR